MTLTVGVVDLEGTEEYKDFKDLVKIGLGDTVRCYNKKLDISTEARCIGMKWDCIRDCVDSVTLGDYQTTFVQQMVSTIERISSVFRDDGTLMADKIAGVLDAMQTQLRYQQNAAKRMTVRAILFEDLDETSPLYGAMAMGTQGLEISKTRTADGRNWDWTTAMTAEGIMAGTIIAGIISDKTGKSWWNLDTGEMQMTGRFRQFTSSGLRSLDIFNNQINLYAWDSNGEYLGSLRSATADDKTFKAVELTADYGDRVRLTVLKKGAESGESANPVFSGSKDYTAMYAIDGEGNIQEIIGAAFDDEVPYIRGGANGFFSACGERIDVQNGLITNITEATAFSGTLDLISGLGWNGNGITEVDRTKITVKNGAIINYTESTEHY